ncbi:MAG: tRNA uridine-5-carboxymethylaminomethyl(34) synthesis enzyme MnmG [Legionellales bacterium]|nr:tRNA uridine-5-carboxymethylaminomethyl(34) synthesis enzyme MnmG [Legionellales bacterium]
MRDSIFDVIVIGGGHAGVEAAAAAARMGSKTALITQNIDTIGQMSCNPAIGGIGKSHLVKEIDALDGLMARAIDRAGIQFRMLNVRKGLAVQSTRAQADRGLYRQAIHDLLGEVDCLSIFQSTIESLMIEGNQCVGVKTFLGQSIRAQAVVLAVGTFLGGRIHVGEAQIGGGRAGDPPSNALSDQLRAYGWPVGRLKTGTPPRIDARTIDFSKLEAQPGDDPVPVFSFLGNASEHPDQISCYITTTSERCHEIIQNNLHRSPMVTGAITPGAVGPRYCPSIEDKVKRFDRPHHQVFLEPEGLHSNEIYPNGISTSLPFSVQCDFVRAMPGLESAWITRPGYAIEYDYFDPQALSLTLETRDVNGLFLCGQINGTTGYEEAAAQGIIAGINAASIVQGRAPLILRRDQAYIGVMIDDLVTLGTQEPYRMFTSRAEYRLSLREDNADERLTALGYQQGVVSEDRWVKFQSTVECKKRVWHSLSAHLLSRTTLMNSALSEFLPQQADESISPLYFLKRSDIDLKTLRRIDFFRDLDSMALHYWMTEQRYEGYLARQKKDIDRLKQHELQPCPKAFDYSTVRGLSSELVEKLNHIQPHTLGQASRIAGMTPAALKLLQVWFKKHGNSMVYEDH